MTVLEEGLRTYIEAQVASAGKGFPGDVPIDEAAPAWAYQTIDDEQLLAHDGGTGFYTARVQLDFHAKESGGLSDYANAKEIAALARAKLDGFKGDWSGVKVKYCKTTLSDDWAEINKLPVSRLDVLINYKLS